MITGRKLPALVALLIIAALLLMTMHVSAGNAEEAVPGAGLKGFPR